MELMEAIKRRNSVRNYLEKQIEDETKRALTDEIAACNKESGLHIQLITEEKDAFGGFMGVHYGKFKGVSNYIAMVGKKGADLDEKIGYYGERLILKAQQLGLNSCWVALSYSKRKSRCVVDKGEKQLCVISLGYGENEGVPHKSKKIEELYRCPSPEPVWFMKGMEAAILAPTTLNQQKFIVSFVSDGKVKIESTGGFYPKVDLGIVKYHFEAGAGREHITWV